MQRCDGGSFASSRQFMPSMVIIACLVISGFAFTAIVTTTVVRADGLPPYGTKQDVKHAKRLWKSMRRSRLVGKRRLSPHPVKGKQPHGAIQQITAGSVRVGKRRVRVVVKANHRGEGVSVAGVYENPRRFLTGYAVMAKRPGYDAKHEDWFWAVFNPDGSVRKFKGTAIAGRVDTGSTDGCIGCHVKKGGKDLEILTRQ